MLLYDLRVLQVQLWFSTNQNRYVRIAFQPVAQQHLQLYNAFLQLYNAHPAQRMAHLQSYRS